MSENSSCLNNNSLIPSIKESERFIFFLNDRFKLNLPSNFIVVINKTNKSALGSFSNIKTREHFVNTIQELNTITLNTYYLKECNAYEVLAHELAHFVNFLNKVKDCSGNQYHNKHFKTQAEKFLLKVSRTNKGYSFTEITDEFKEMLKEFKPHKEVFNVFQAQAENKEKKGSRLRLYVCDCGVKVRVASDTFQAECLICNSKFKQDEK